jgi:hypothetical protein
MRRAALFVLVASFLAGCSREEPEKLSAGTVSDTSIVVTAPTASSNPQPTELEVARERVGEACVAYAKRRDEMRADPDIVKDGPFRMMWVFIVADVISAADTLKTVDAYALSSVVQKQWDNFWQGIDSGATTFVTYEEWFESYVEVIDRYCLTVVPLTHLRYQTQ